MKAKMIRISAVLLAALTVLALASCNKDKRTEEKLVGTWRATADFIDTYNSALKNKDEDTRELLSMDSFAVDLIFEFKSDGTCALKADETSVAKTLQSLKDSVSQGMITYIEKSHVEAGYEMTLDEYLDALGMTRDEYAQHLIGNMDLDSYSKLFDGINSEGYCKVKANRLYISETKGDYDNYSEFTLDDNTLTLVYGRIFAGMESVLPLVFE